MSNHPHMSNADRAKQFMPFAALKGYEEALHIREKITVPRIELSEDKKEELDRKLHMINSGDIITVTYFRRDPSASDGSGEYLDITGNISRLDVNAKVMQIANMKIHLYDVYDLKGENFVD